MQEIDTYRTIDGKTQFSFEFNKIDDVYQIKLLFAPSEIKADVISQFCFENNEDEILILLDDDQNPKDLHIAKLTAGEWSEHVCKQLNQALLE